MGNNLLATNKQETRLLESKIKIRKNIFSIFPLPIWIYLWEPIKGMTGLKLLKYIFLRKGKNHDSLIDINKYVLKILLL